MQPGASVTYEQPMAVQPVTTSGPRVACCTSIKQ